MRQARFLTSRCPRRAGLGVSLSVRYGEAAALEPLPRGGASGRWPRDARGTAPCHVSRRDAAGKLDVGNYNAKTNVGLDILGYII
jgi:hypothetical protein